MSWRQVLGLDGLPDAELRSALRELCARGVLTCTRGRPGDDGALYALAWLPLDEPEKYPRAVRHRHRENMRRLGAHEGTRPDEGRRDDG